GRLGAEAGLEVEIQCGFFRCDRLGNRAPATSFAAGFAIAFRFRCALATDWFAGFARHRLAPASRHAGTRCGHQCSRRRRRGAVSVLVESIVPGQASGSSIVTLPAAISRNAVTTSLLSDSTSGRAPLSNCLARRAAPSTSSKRLGMFARQSSTVIRAIRGQLSGARRFLSTRAAAGKELNSRRNLILVKPAVGFTLPSAGVTPAPGTKIKMRDFVPVRTGLLLGPEFVDACAQLDCSPSRPEGVRD